MSEKIEIIIFEDNGVKKMPINKSRCSYCEAFIEDWLNMPLQPGEYFYTKSKWKKIQPFTKILAKYLCKIIHDLVPLENSLLESHIDAYRNQIRSAVIPTDMQKEHIPFQMVQTIEWMSVIEGFMDTRFIEEIEIMTDILQSNSIISNPIIVNEWIGCWITRVNTVIPSMHLEHTKQKTCSYTGPPLTE
jgi:hypothetical protein